LCQSLGPRVHGDEREGLCFDNSLTGPFAGYAIPIIGARWGFAALYPSYSQMLYCLRMNDFATAFQIAVALICRFDVELREIVSLSLQVSLTASACAFAIGAPLGTALAVYRFRGRGAVVVLANTLLGLPPVVVGLMVYLLLSRSGPLGPLGLLFTPTAMMIAQTVLATPIVIALVHRVAVGLWRAYGDSLLISGASRFRAIAPLMRMGREGLLTAFLAAFGRAIAEVGAIIIVGGNIRGYTRSMTTTIALETSRGDLSLALALGIILLVLSMAVSAGSLYFGRSLTDR
jgi:tungstate transport system permease protein